MESACGMAGGLQGQSSQWMEYRGMMAMARPDAADLYGISWFPVYLIS